MDIGTRVGAYFKLENNICYFLGWGVYLGDFQNPRAKKILKEEAKKVLGTDASEEEINTYIILNRQTGESIPKFQLDNADIVWADECHWGKVEDVEKIINNKKIINIRYKRDSKENIEDIIPIR